MNYKTLFLLGMILIPFASEAQRAERGDATSATRELNDAVTREFRLIIKTILSLQSAV